MKNPLASPPQYSDIVDSARSMAYKLVHRPNVKTADHLNTSLYSLSSNDGVFCSLEPPKAPEPGMDRVSCDIVLVIDVSGSMCSPAPLPDIGDGKKSESTGLTILDLVKHAAKTILATLNEDDRLSVVTFSSEAKVVSELKCMTPGLKKQIGKKIENLRVEGVTNLWAGIRTGLKMFANVRQNGNVQGLFVLTDGQPNHMCPPQGYVPKLKPMLSGLAKDYAQIPTINTFGFGYDIRSGLLQSIAEVGTGSYAFIPDAGMIGTVFIHAVASLYSTFATNTVLEIETESGSRVRCDTVANTSYKGNKTELRLGSLHYGHSRNFIIHADQPGHVTAKVRYQNRFGEHEEEFIDLSMDEPRQDLLQYHLFRSDLCAFLASLFPQRTDGEHEASELRVINSSAKKVRQMADCFRSSAFAQNPAIGSLINDLVGDAGTGQISQALLPKYWQRWGKHFLPSLLHAHCRQGCNSFKDPGPLQYGTESPVFLEWRDRLDTAFEDLPPPEPSNPYDSYGQHVAPVSMSRYHNSNNGCFDGDCPVRLGDDSTMSAKDVRSGMQVWTPSGARQVVAIVRSLPKDNSGMLVRVGDCWLTPWHPIKIEGVWRFPVEILDDSRPCDSDVYSFLLSASEDRESHSVEVGGHLCVTLGHGIIGRMAGDARGHAFFGDYRRVVQSLSKLSVDDCGRFVSFGVSRDAKRGLITGFVPVDDSVVKVVEARGPADTLGGTAIEATA